MALIDLLKEVNEDISDIFLSEFETPIPKAYKVPSCDDPGFNFSNGDSKQGKLIETCVLFIDIRNSTKINRKNSKQKERLGKLYGAFVKAMVEIADEFGFVRNIIGDRVMVVFEPDNCTKHAIDCASVMHPIANKLIKKYSNESDFSCGIGIDFGEMLVIKVGKGKKSTERSEYKNLVWLGEPANIASKLTDCSNKTIRKKCYDFTITYRNILKGINKPLYPQHEIGLAAMLSGNYGYSSPKGETDMEQKNYTKMTEQEFLTGVYFKDNEMWFKENGVFLHNGQINSLKENVETIYLPAILMTGRTYLKYKKENSNSDFIKRDDIKSYPYSLREYSSIYGTNISCGEYKEFLIHLNKK